MTESVTGDTATAAKAVRESLYEIIQRDIPFEQKANESLELGKQYLGVDNGHLTRIDQENDHWEIIASTDGMNEQFHPGLEHDLGTTYCRRTIEINGQVALHDAPNQGWADDPAFESHGIACYHGAAINLGGEPYGTVCFVREQSREQFSNDETMFVELLAQLLGRELEREQQEAQLTRQTNLATVLNRVLRHNLKNKISIIRGYTQQMSDDLGNPEYSQIPLENTDELLDLSEKARSLNRIINADFKTTSTSITEIVDELSDQMSAKYRNATITVEYDSEISATVLPSLDRALHELIENAAKHGGEQPVVKIAVKSVPNAIEIHIADNGPGLDEEESEVLETGSETPLIHGSGLGLWIAHWIVSSHGGSIDATTSDQGTTMTVTIPRDRTGNIDDELTKLTQARDQYQAAFERANDAMVIVNDDAQIIEANPKASHIYGMDEQALLGQSLMRFFPDDFDVDAFWRKSHEEGTELDTMTIVGNDKVERTIEYSAANNIVPGQTLLISRDITSRLKRYQALQEATQQLDATFEALLDPVIAFDADEQITMWNGAAESLFGYTAEEARGQQLQDLDLFSDGTDSAFQSHIKQAVAGKTIENFRITRQNNTGDQVDLNVSTAPLKDDAGQITGVVAVLRDPT